MRAVRRTLLVVTLAVASAWGFELVRSGATLLALFDVLGAARVDEPGPRAATQTRHELGPAVEPAASAAATSVDSLPPQSIASEGFSGEQIRHLLADEIASDTDPDAADELLRAFDESLDAPTAR